MKTDNHLDFCLDQTAKSPLHYPDSAFIVRSGKVIGQGYNDYRTGFNGGLKGKYKLRPAPNLEAPIESVKTFMPSEMIGGGKLANTPLSMQSGVMAIQRTLSTTSCAASGALSSQKSCFRLSGDSKRTAPLQREAMKLYVGTVCKQSVAKQDAGKSQVQEWQFEQSAPRSGYAKSCIHDEEKEDMALPAENSTKKQGIKNEKKNHHHNTGNQDSNGKHTHKHSRDAHKSRASKTIVVPHGSQTDAPDRCLELMFSAGQGDQFALTRPYLC